MAYLGSCNRCTSSGSTWCGGAQQFCGSAATACATATCVVTSSLGCATYGSPNCGVVSTVARDAEAAALATLTKAIAASAAVGVVIGLLAALVTRRCPPGDPSDASPAMAAWKARASRSWALLSLGVALHAVGVCTGLAAPAVPWLVVSAGDAAAAGLAGVAWSPLELASTAFSGAVAAGPVQRTTAGAIVCYASMVLNLPALALAMSAQARCAAVAALGVAPPVMALGPGLPALQGLAWGGALLFTIGAAVNFYYFGQLRAGGGAPGPGESLGAAAAALLLAAAASYSVVATRCVLAHLPGLGTSGSNCCLTEQDPVAQPPEAGVAVPMGHEAAAPKVGLQVRAPAGVAGKEAGAGAAP